MLTPRGVFDAEYQLFRLKAAPDAARYPVGVGNMVVGTVEEVGAEVTDLAPATRLRVIGGFADVVVTAVERCSPRHGLAHAVCLDPAEFAFNAVRDGHVRLGDNVAIFSWAPSG